GSHYTEFERTILSFISLHLLLDGSDASYTRFTSQQKQDVKLKKKEFSELHNFAKSVVGKSQDRINLLETALLLGDMGKTPLAIEKAKKKCSIGEKDHDIFLAQCLNKCPGIFPSYMKLSKHNRNKIKRMEGIIHLGHVTHLENGARLFAKLKKAKVLLQDKEAFNIFYLAHICDVAGALGHVNNQGSIVYNSNTYQIINSVYKSVEMLATTSETEALLHYLKFRANLLGIEIRGDEDYVKTRIGTMLRLVGVEQGKYIEQSWSKLSIENQMLLTAEFHPLQNFPGETPTYIPAVLNNLMNKYKSKEEGLNIVINNGIPLIINILNQYKKGQANIPFNENLTLNFNYVAKQIKNVSHIDQNTNSTIRNNGIVELLI
ncbi:MAG: hypothetical protein HRT87_08800, partial [Legionellales bacterium]|nr:hypothetical protein [Legionellales bacterium]